MTLPPPTFENYPGGAADDQNASTGQGPQPVPSPPSPKVSRRTVLTVAATGIGIASLSYLGARSGGPEAPQPSPSPSPSSLPPSDSPPSDDDPDPDDSDLSQVDVGYYTVSFTGAWTVTSQQPNLLRLTHDSAVVIFRYYEPPPNADIGAEARRNLRKLTDDLVSGAVKTTTRKKGEPYQGHTTTTGTSNGRTYSAEAMVCMDSYGYEALAVIWIVDGEAKDRTKKELHTMRTKFLGQFG